MANNALSSIVITNKSTKEDIKKWAQETGNVEWLKRKAAEKVEKKVYPKVVGADGKMVDDKSKPYTIVMKKQTFLGIKKAVMAEFFTTKKKEEKKDFIDEILSL